ncbi:MAG TPA: trehalose-phosphatase [Leptospiraceae bacterium]|nr:trehalose-phosphatase [Leptospirales bacterium]HMU83382.1 trehalose-phosphatase [Leptospiraceae bacterium]HMX57153.1 trehalose-phosphatase [Leptospiraceae bacterium]HMY47050.1 trehalose-phosphatase [Leptospiraceae bacterium]HMZ36163.1 trehalose-phosphatase [Leptospiraceae bacterium]
MKDILSRKHVNELSLLIARKPLIAFDFDGTLAPIVDDRDSACMRASTRRLLRRLSRCLPCVVISGRMRSDVCARLEGIPLVAIVGNHGSEWEGDDHDHALLERVRNWKELLKGELPRDGVSIEDKSVSLSVHTRHNVSSPDIRRILNRLTDAKVIGGKRVYNIVPAEAGGKGEALLRMMQECKCDCALYIGDDDTDEDVFALFDSEIMTIRVGQSRNSSAAYYIASQAQIDTLLEKMLSWPPCS